jgi:hypothetical protein
VNPLTPPPPQKYGTHTMALTAIIKEIVSLHC